MKNKMDARGVSPVIATILLIAATGIAAGVIITYVGGLYVASPTIRDVNLSGQVRDWNENAAENYKNGPVFITAQVTSGALRDVGDPSYGFLVTLTNTRTAKTYFIGLGTGNNDEDEASAIENYGKVVTLVKTFPNVSSADNLVITLRMSPTTAGDLRAGSAITIDMRIGGTSPDQTTDIWTVRDTINVVISGRDPQTKTGYDGAYLLGVPYTA